jgi:hypothetical protein
VQNNRDSDPLPLEPGVRWNIRYRLHRRVIEIRDAQLVLRPYSAAEVADLATAMARESGLPSDQAAAVVEAAVIVSSLQWRVLGSAHHHDDAPKNHVAAVPANDIRAEATRLILVSRAVRHSRIVRRIAVQRPLV